MAKGWGTLTVLYSKISPECPKKLLLGLKYLAREGGDNQFLPTEMLNNAIRSNWIAGKPNKAGSTDCSLYNDTFNCPPAQCTSMT